MDEEQKTVIHHSVILEPCAISLQLLEEQPPFILAKHQFPILLEVDVLENSHLLVHKLSVIMESSVKKHTDRWRA